MVPRSCLDNATCGGARAFVIRDPENTRRHWNHLVLRDRAILPDINSRVARIDHIQIAAPEGCERAARDFYGSVLGMKAIEKPPILRARGGCWFECGLQQVHIGVERNFQAAKKAAQPLPFPIWTNWTKRSGSGA
jgi:hypothetical protein